MCGVAWPVSVSTPSLLSPSPNTYCTGSPASCGTGERPHLDIAQRKRMMGIDLVHTDFRERGTLRTQGAVRQPDGNSELTRQTGNPADMVAVFVCDENAAQLFGLQPETGQTGECFTEGESAIQQQRAGTRLYYQRIAFAATAQKRKTHHCDLLLQVLEQHIQHAYSFLGLRIATLTYRHNGCAPVSSLYQHAQVCGRFVLGIGFQIDDAPLLRSTSPAAITALIQRQSDSCAGRGQRTGQQDETQTVDLHQPGSGNRLHLCLCSRGHTRLLHGTRQITPPPLSPPPPPGGPRWGGRGPPPPQQRGAPFSPFLGRPPRGAVAAA